MQQDPLTIETLPGKAEGTRILRITGPVVLQNFFSLQSAIDHEHLPVTIFDLSGVPYMDSAGMGAIIKSYVSAQRRGQKVIAAGPNYRVLELFKLTKVDGLIPITETVEQAEAL
ncbi:anti-anti-sigma factor [Silvibacterium bohemicum]|uniref:Anti-anti-sigma factor n=1 Tax=Silvibacterium bohemicum TaxID=1577686 RepID=A0A841JX19_9BACT|nr:STAS domain-containing protein [Silvibacterium bohemicum]MBB6142544.1 anti-anti-sigma factor [Silvibacterium bohemicum]